MDTILDFLGTFFFAISGCLLAAHRGFDIVGSALLGLLTGLGGGVIRDILTGDTPMVFRDGELYALAALGGCLVVVICRELDFPRTLTSLAGMGAVLILRFGSVRWGWTSWVPR